MAAFVISVLITCDRFFESVVFSPKPWLQQKERKEGRKERKEGGMGGGERRKKKEKN